MASSGTGSQLRALRATCFAALCVTLSVTSHVLLSHTPLPLPTVAAAFAAVFAVAYGLGGRERGFWAIAALLVPLELAADTLFTSGQRTCYGPGGGPVTGTWRALTCHGSVGGPAPHDLSHGLYGDPAGAGRALHAVTAGPGQGAPGVGCWLLLAAHVAVGLAASWWLRRGEAACHRVLRLAFRPLLVAFAVLRDDTAWAPRASAVGASGTGRPAPSLPLLTHSVVRRGPPFALAV
jgi:hypothetical protein